MSITILRGYRCSIDGNVKSKSYLLGVGTDYFVSHYWFSGNNFFTHGSIVK